MRLAHLLQPLHQLVIRHAARTPQQQALVVRGFGMVRVRGQGVRELPLRFLLHPQVEQADSLITQRIGQRGCRLGLLPRVGPACDLRVHAPKPVSHHPEVSGPVFGIPLEALPQRPRQLLRHLGDRVVFGPDIEVAVQGLGRRLPRQPRHFPSEHFQHRHGPTPDVRPTRELVPIGLLRRAIRRRHTPDAQQDAPTTVRHELHPSRRPSLGQAEVRHFGDAIRRHHHVPRLHVPVDQSLLMRVVQAPCKLDRDVQDSFESLIRAAFVKPSAVDPVPQTAAFDVFREDPRNAPQHPHVVAAHHLRVEPQPDPRKALPYEALPVLRSLEELPSRALDREILLPVPVMHSVHQPHASTRVDRLHFVAIQDHIPDLPFCRHFLGLLVASWRPTSGPSVSGSRTGRKRERGPALLAARGLAELFLVYLVSFAALGAGSHGGSHGDLRWLESEV